MPKLLAHEQELQQTINEKSARLTQLLRQKDTANQAEAIRSELKFLQAEHEQALARIRAASPQYAALTQPQSVSLPDLQRELEADTLLLEFALGEKHSYLWAISQQSFQSYELPGRAQVEPLARRAYESLTAHTCRVANDTPMQRETRLAQADRAYAQDAEKLSQILLGPIQTQLKAKHLLVVADGALHYLPFAALPLPIGAGVRVSNSGFRGQNVGAQTRKLKTQNSEPLIISHEIISLPSATTLHALRHAEKQPSAVTQDITIFADPVFDEHDPRVKPQAAARAATRPPPPASFCPKLTQALRSLGIAEESGLIPRLPFTRREGQAISRLVPASRQLKALGFQANRQQASAEELAPYRMLHFATHGLADSVNPGSNSRSGNKACKLR